LEVYNKKDMKKETIFLILIVICIFLFVYTIVQFIQNKDLITTDALTYGMKTHNFTYCQCFDGNNGVWESKDGGFLKTG
jgi:hypothetical protein